MRILIWLVVNLMAKSIDTNYSTVAIFNNWTTENKPVKFSWSPGQDEKLIGIENTLKNYIETFIPEKS